METDLTEETLNSALFTLLNNKEILKYYHFGEMTNRLSLKIVDNDVLFWKPTIKVSNRDVYLVNPNSIDENTLYLIFKEFDFEDKHLKASFSMPVEGVIVNSTLKLSKTGEWKVEKYNLAET